MSKPFITVYTPFHTPEYADKAQIALASLEAQEFRSFETILVCNGTRIPEYMCRDSFFSNTCAAFGRRLIAGPYHTLAAAANAALALARGEYIVRLDADDEFIPDALMEYARIVKANPFAAIEGHWDDSDETFGGGLLLPLRQALAVGYDEDKPLSDGEEIVRRMGVGLARTSYPVYVYSKQPGSMTYA